MAGLCHDHYPFQRWRDHSGIDACPPLFTHPASHTAHYSRSAALANGLAHLTHTLLYALFITLPILGLTSRYLKGREWWLFGISMPVAPEPDFDMADMLIGWHETLAPLGYWLIGLHAAAALFHHYLLKDNTLLRMMPARRRGQ